MFDGKYRKTSVECVGSGTLESTGIYILRRETENNLAKNPLET